MMLQQTHFMFTVALLETHFSITAASLQQVPGEQEMSQSFSLIILQLQGSEAVLIDPQTCEQQRGQKDGPLYIFRIDFVPICLRLCFVNRPTLFDNLSWHSFFVLTDRLIFKAEEERGRTFCKTTYYRIMSVQLFKHGCRAD